METDRVYVVTQYFWQFFITGSRVQGPDLHRHPRVLHRQEDNGYHAGEEGNFSQLRTGGSFLCVSSRTVQ